MKNLIYGTNTNLYSPGDIRGLLKTSMRERFKGLGKNFHVWKDQVVVKLSKDDLFRIVENALLSTATGILTAPQISHSFYSAYTIEFTLGQQDPSLRADQENLLTNSDLLRVQIDLNYNEDGYDYEPDSAAASTQEILIAFMEGFGDPELLNGFTKAFRAFLRQAQEAGKSSLVSWIFAADDGARDKTFQIKKTWSMDRTFYPWIETDLRDYYRAFLESRSQILVLYGPPGTGKTSFIRDLLCEMNLNSYISYDMKILTSDSTFVNYVTGSIFDAVVIEDADDLLTAERGEQNKVIAKILNVSDGLIKLPRKKLIFTTNLENVDEIDPAIIRPGRCFDVMEFRPMNYDEAVVAAKGMGLELTEKKDKYTLAELFFAKDIQDCTDPFTRKHGEQLKKKSIGFY